MSKFNNSGVKLRSSEKDQLIADLRKQLYDLKNQERDYRGVSDDIFNMENRYSQLSNDRARSDVENRARIDRGMDDIADNRKQLEDLKYMLCEKNKQNQDLADELQRSKRFLDEKYFEAGRLRDENNTQADQNSQLSAQVNDVQNEIEKVKAQRAEMWREIQHNKEQNDNKIRESGQQNDKTKQLEFDLQRARQQIDDTQKLLDARSSDLRAKQIALGDTENELARVRDFNLQLKSNNAAASQDCERQQVQNYETRKEIEFSEGRNCDISVQIRDTELRLKDREDALMASRREVENQRIMSSQNRNANGDLLAEKDALEKHASILNHQNNDLTSELDRFCQTDQVLRQQLDRRQRVTGMQNKNQDELRYSYNRVEEARSKSPSRSPSKY